MPTRHFSLEEARALIPQVQPHLRMALHLHAALRPIVHAINEAGYDVDWEMLAGEVEFDDEARPVDVRNLLKARALYESLRQEIEAIEAIGCEVKGVVDGLIDFRSWRDGQQEVCLCWRLGEASITHYHELEGGFAGRRGVEGERFVATREGQAQAGVEAEAAALEVEIREPESAVKAEPQRIVVRTK